MAAAPYVIAKESPKLDSNRGVLVRDFQTANKIERAEPILTDGTCQSYRDASTRLPENNGPNTACRG